MKDLEKAPWSVHKFGGSSLADSALIRRAADRILEQPESNRTAVVVSAMGGVTDELLRLLNVARDVKDVWEQPLRELGDRYITTLAEICPSETQPALTRHIEEGLTDLEHLFQSVRLIGGTPIQASELVTGYGELWCAPLLAAHLVGRGVAATWLDARDVLVVRPGESGPVVDEERSAKNLADWLRAHDERIVVVTGFIARTPEGIPTTLGRNGSDYSASLFGALLGADSITIWTDVSGVLTADPRQVPEAFPVADLSYDEAVELAYFGAKVLHPQTMAPAIENAIPIHICNSGKPEVAGTWIGRPGGNDTAPTRPEEAVRAFSTVDDVALINVEGTGMIGVPGISERVFGALKQVGVSVMMISQASSEHSICFAVPGSHADKAIAALEEALFSELHHGVIQRVETTGPCTLLAAVGDAMAQTPGVSARLFSSLAHAGVNVRAVAQGASERNLTVVVDGKDSTRALRAVHTGFYLSEAALNIGIIGAGVVGRTFVEQLHQQAPALLREHRLNLRVQGIARSRKSSQSEEGIDLGAWLSESDPGRESTDLDQFVDRLTSSPSPHRVLVDCTASEDIASRYAGWLTQGVHVVTANKKAGSAASAEFTKLRSAQRRHKAHFFYEATVGAGLPIINTMQDLRTTGDRILRIEGVLSGTLSYLFNEFDGDLPFSKLLRSAKESGFTEPDPRDDLSGTDVARKLVILAREAGLNLDLADVEVESLVPAALGADCDVDGFLDGLADHDGAMATRLKEATDRGEVLRYTGAVECRDDRPTAVVSLGSYGKGHPFAGLTGTDNIVALTTDRYLTQPLIVRGPGAGPAVTAGGIFGDLLRLAAYLGSGVGPL